MADYTVIGFLFVGHYKPCIRYFELHSKAIEKPFTLSSYAVPTTFPNRVLSWFLSLHQLQGLIFISVT